MRVRSSVLLWPIIIIIIAHISIDKESHTSFGVIWGDNLAVGMGSDFDLRDQHYRTGNGQEQRQVKFEHMTLKASLFSPPLRKPAPDRRRIFASAQMKREKHCPELIDLQRKVTTSSP